MRRGRIGFWYRLGIALVKPPALLLSRRSSWGVERIPPGGVVLVSNHVSLLDPVVLCDFLLYDVRRTPRFLAKRELFEGRGPGRGLLARVLRGAGQIPVDRHTPDASRALEPALAALRAGELVVLYPEGTVTRDPGGWPMVARTGVARLALLSGAPVVPVAQWGAHRRAHDPRPQRVLRRPVRFRVGPPVDLTPWAGRELTREVLREATDAVMDALTVELEVLRGQRAPRPRCDPRADPPAAGDGVRTEERRSA